MKTALIFPTILAFALCGFAWAEQTSKPQRPESEEQILRQLEIPVTLVPLQGYYPESRPVPLKKAVQMLCKQTEIQNWYLDESALHEAGVLTDTHVQVPPAKGVKMKSLLNTILAPQGLAYVVKNEYLVITTKKEAKGSKFARFYYVGDFVNFDVEAADPAALTIERMFDIIQSVIEPDSWTDGDSYITVHASTKSLAVRQTEYAHAQIEDLINQLRKLNEEKQQTSSPSSETDYVLTGALRDHWKIDEEIQQTSSLASEEKENSRPLFLRERMRGRALTATSK